MHALNSHDHNDVRISNCTVKECRFGGIYCWGSKRTTGKPWDFPSGAGVFTNCYIGGCTVHDIARLDPALASNMLGDLIDYYRRHDAFECVNATGQQKIAGYGASVANPLAAIRRMREGKITNQ